MTLSIHRRPFLGRLAQAPKVFVQNYRNLRPYARSRWDAFATAFRTTWILLRPLVDESRCRICKDTLFPGDRGRLCPTCAIPAGFLATLSLLALFVAALATFGCASRPRAAIEPYQLTPTDYRPLPWCWDEEAARARGGCCKSVEMLPAERLGRGSAERETWCATWEPLAKETR